MNKYILINTKDYINKTLPIIQALLLQRITT